MRKSWMMILSCTMAISLMAGSAFAKSENGNSANKKEAGTTSQEVEAQIEADTDLTVTSATYGNKGHKGLLHAINNVKDKPAGAVIAELLLSKYDTELTAEMKAELEIIIEKDLALSKAAEFLEENGSVTEAVYVQKDAIRANVKNINSYKKLGKMYEKMGKKGLKLYVNGEEPSLETAPFIRDGSTLVPFRAISEALNAEVIWNQDERSVTVTRDGITVKLFIDSKTAYVDGNPLTLDVPAGIVNNRTVVPVRFVSEALKAAVKWEAETQSVIIYEQ